MEAPYGGFWPGVGIVERRGFARDVAQAIRGARRKQVRVGAEHLRRELLQRREVVHDPEASPVGRDDEIVEVLLHRDPVHRRARHVGLQRLPAVAIVERHVDRVLGAEVEQAAAHGVFPDAVRVTQHALRNAVGDRAPGLAVVGGLVHERIAIVHLVQVDGEVRRARVDSATARCCRPCPTAEGSGMFSVTLVHDLPLSRVT